MGEISVSPLIATSIPTSFAATPAVAGETRVGYTATSAAWADNDAIGLFCSPINASNIQFTMTTVESSPAWSTSTPIYWQDGVSLHTFLAYYPYASGSTNAAAIPLPALNAQKGTPLNPALDLMISNNQNSLGVTRTAGSVPLIFTHALALVEFDIKIGNGFAANTTLGSFTLTAGLNEKLYTTDNTSTIALTTGQITRGTTTNTQTFTPATLPVLSSTATPVYAFILPGTYTASDLTVTIKDGGTTAYTTAALPLATLTFVAGSKYTYTVTISRSAITISNPTITDWIPVQGLPLNPIL